MATTISGTTITFNDGTTQTTTGIEFASGTVMMFRQTAAPTGWTKDTTNYNDHALRVVTGTISSGGTVNFSTAMASQAVSGSIGDTTATNQNTTAGGSVAISGGSVSATTLNSSTMPSHNHSLGLWRPDVPQVFDYYAAVGATNHAWFTYGGTSSSPYLGYSASVGGSGSHSHGFTNPSGSFTGSAHTHTQNAHNHTFTGTAINMAVKYCDVIFATKN